MEFDSLNVPSAFECLFEIAMGYLQPEDAMSILIQGVCENNPVLINDFGEINLDFVEEERALRELREKNGVLATCAVLEAKLSVDRFDLALVTDHVAEWHLIPRSANEYGERRAQVHYEGVYELDDQLSVTPGRKLFCLRIADENARQRLAASFRN